MRMAKKRKRLWAVLLSVTLLVTQLPAAVLAEGKIQGVGYKQIESFEPLAADVAEQTVPAGTAYETLKLPDRVRAKVSDRDRTPATSSNAEKGAAPATPSGADKATAVVEEISVTWNSVPDYDGGMAGTYVFTAAAGGYRLSGGVALPKITVTVTPSGIPPVNSGIIKTIQNWTFVDGDHLSRGELHMIGVNIDNQADFNAVVAMLPAKIRAEIQGEESPVLLDIVCWSCPEYRQTGGHWPLDGEYIFTAELPEGYACDPVPAVKVLLGGADIFAVSTFGGLDVETSSGSQAKQDIDGQIILGEGTYKISGEWNGTLVAGGSNSKSVITVPSGVTANVTLNNVTITNVSGMDNVCAFAVEPSGTANITLSGTNTLSSGIHRAGLEVPENANVTIDGDGSLTAESYKNGAGIGGGIGNGGTIEIIGGTVTAYGGSFSAGIGGGENGNGGTIKISGDAVVIAKNGSGGAGIGGGNGGSGGTIEITGGTVTTIGSMDSYDGAGIGGGNGGNGGTIRISGDASVTAQGASGAGIGGGYGGNGGTIRISGNAIVMAQGGTGGSAGIGGGGIGNGGIIEISGGTVTAIGGTASGGYDGAGIGGGYKSGEGQGDGGNVRISGRYTIVIATGHNSSYDVGSGHGSKNGGSLSVTDGATLEMKNTGTNVGTPEFKNCTIINKDKKAVQYGSSGLPMASPTLSLTADPADTMILPDTVILTAILSDAYPDNSGRNIKFSIGTTINTVSTDSSGKAIYKVSNLLPGTYSFGASFEGDTDNNPVSATEISSYLVCRGTQDALTLNGLGSTYTYGSKAFALSVSGGSGSGAVRYESSDPSVAKVTGNTVMLLKAGTFTITATKAEDSHYGEAAVTSGIVTVKEATPNIILTATGGSTTSEALVLTATVSKAGTGATPAGAVTFKKENTPLGTVLLDNSGTASLTINNPSAGSCDYTVEYSGQTDYYNKASTTHTIGVGLTEQVGFTIADPGIKTYGDGDFTLMASGGQSTGRVRFSVSQGNGVLEVTEDGAAKIMGAGTVRVTATKEADPIYKEASAVLDLTVAPRDISNVTVSVTGPRVYTGSRLQPAFEVTDGRAVITGGDYTNRYDTNVDAGTGAGGIMLTGQRNYTGTKTVRFDIEKRSLTGASVTLTPGPYSYTGSEIRPAVTGIAAEGISVPLGAVEVEYENNRNAGTALVIVRAKGDSNFRGTAETTFSITETGSGNSSDRDSSDNSSEEEDSYTRRKEKSEAGQILQGTWVQTETGIWMFKQTDGTYAENRWGMENGQWYSFNEKGHMRTGWYFDPAYQKWFYFEKSGAMVTGWLEIDGKWYYFNPVSDGNRGIMVTDLVVDGWYVDQDGVWDGEEKKE